MPIKFRCDYCRQLLGIAHSKAGSLVDCPTCGRTLRVPNQDGTVDPPPAVGLDLADDGLRRALDELAQLGQEKEQPSAELDRIPSAASVELSAGGEQATRGALPSPPVSVKPKPLVQTSPPLLPQSNAIALEPLPPMVVVNPPVAPQANPGGINQTVPAASLAGVSPEEIVAGLAVPSPVARVPGPAVANSPVVRSYALKWLILASLVSGLVGAGLGIGLSRALTSSGLTVRQPAVTPEVGPAVTKARPLVKGRITFRNARGQLEPDAGACLVLLPSPTNEGLKLSFLGLRPNDETATRQAALELLAKQGGRLAIADGDGNFQFELPAAGNYRWIALSHYQGRSADDAGPAEARKAVEENFDRPEQLVGKLAFEVHEINHAGTGTVIWDHTFSAARSD